MSSQPRRIHTITVPLYPNDHHNQRSRPRAIIMANDPTKNIPGADAESAKTIRKIAELLGVADATDIDALQTAFDKLFKTQDGVAARVLSTPHGSVRLSAREVRMCEEMKCSIEAYAEQKALRDRR